MRLPHPRHRDCRASSMCSPGSVQRADISDHDRFPSGHSLAPRFTMKESEMRQPVLVPLDGSELAEQALPYAEAVAGSKCQLILLEVGDDGDNEFLLQQRQGESCAYLHTVFGDPVEQILGLAQELDAGLIVMTTRGRGAVGRTALGSVADAVTCKSAIPVMLIRPSYHAPQAD